MKPATFLGSLCGSVEHLTLDFSAGHDLKVVGLSPMSGSVLNMDTDLDSLSLCPPPLLMQTHAPLSPPHPLK